MYEKFNFYEVAFRALPHQHTTRLSYMISIAHVLRPNLIFFWLLISGATPVYLSLSFSHMWWKWKTHELLFFFLEKFRRNLHQWKFLSTCLPKPTHNPKLSRRNNKKTSTFDFLVKLRLKCRRSFYRSSVSGCRRRALVAIKLLWHFDWKWHISSSSRYRNYCQCLVFVTGIGAMIFIRFVMHIYFRFVGFYQPCESRAAQW